MDATTVTLINAAIQDALPTVLGFIRGFHTGTNGQLPTLEQIQAGLAADTATSIGIDTAWLAAHGMPASSVPAPASPPAQ